MCYTKKENEMSLSDSLKNIQMILGLNQSEIAKKIGVCRSTVNRWMMGRNKPDSKLVWKALERLQRKADRTILSWKEELKDKPTKENTCLTRPRKEKHGD